METDRPALCDADLRTNILTGLAATAELEARFRKPLERFLVSSCDRHDGRSQEKAVEIAGQVLAECFVKSPSLLERWQGGDNLEAFLRTVAGNRLRSWWSSAEKTRTEVNSESIAMTCASMPASAVDQEETTLAEQALRAGVEAATKECQEGLLFLRLKGLYGVDQRAISHCWGHHEAQTSRRIKEAMDVIRTAATTMAEHNGAELSLESLQQALHHNPEILLGSHATAAAQGDDAALQCLAAGDADAATKRAAVAMLCQDSRQLGLFAQMLNRHGARDALVVTDPALSGMGARVTECLRRSLEILQPAEAVGLVSPAMAACFADLLAHAGADGGTLWLLCPGKAALEAVFNPMEPEIAGKRQPLVSGIVSLVIATGEPACVAGVEANQRHSPAIDIALGKTTHAMIAVPFVLAGTIRGVLTAVRFTSNKPFAKATILSIGRYADILANLMLQNLTTKILG
jgi:DNA-directed RNA polymerase specialized sigma24 family protein